MSLSQESKLGEILVERHCLLPEQLADALEKQKKTGHRLGDILIQMNLATKDEVTSALMEQTGVPRIWLRKGLIDPKIVTVLPREKAELYQVIPMFKVGGNLTLAMADCSDLIAFDDIETITGCKIQPVRCRAADIEEAINEYYGGSVEMGEFLRGFQESGGEESDDLADDLRAVEDDAEGSNIINLINLIILNAIEAGASDIHVEADHRSSRIRYRTDGVLHEVMTPPKELHLAIVSRLKVMGRMDIAERRVPQDGRINVSSKGKNVDIRVSTMPTVLGEKVVMRLLDKEKMVLDIDKIGVRERQLADLKRMLHRPNGIILVTGPTGSGKTTTLYCGLNLISSIDKNVVTIEDPVEYQLDLVNQVHVNKEQGLTFARTLRAVLRQDPDVVMVGEIRDRETAEVSIQAALTGHLVLSTLHTNESAGAIARLVEMNVEPYTLTSALIGVVAQRLVRLICSHCRTSHFPLREELNRIGWKGESMTFVTSQGCDRCLGSGYKNRTPIFELLHMSDNLRRKILSDPSTQSIRGESIQAGMSTLRDEAFLLVKEGRTSLEEVMRVVFVEDSADEPLPATPA